MKKALLSFVAAFCFLFSAHAQCPPNIDFELGNYSYWSYYIGNYYGSSVPMSWGAASGPVPGRHDLMSGSGVDMYGGFPVVAPGGGAYSLKIGHDTIAYCSEKVTYTFTVPSTPGVWSLIYRYAVVLENPAHAPSLQPKMTISAYPVSTGIAIPCDNYTYISSSTVPGFSLSSIGSSVYTKPWTYGHMKFPGLSGQSVTVDFEAFDCGVAGHFGYGYVDMSCGFFASTTCAVGTATLSAPDGFASYDWYDSATFTTSYGTSQIISVPVGSVTTTYAVIVTPYAGYGCVDTLYTEVIPSSLTIAPGTLARADSDTVICSGMSAPLSAHASSGSGSVTYSWTPSASLSCATCASPVASPTATTVYSVSVSDAAGCNRTGIVTVSVVPAPCAIGGPHSVCTSSSIPLTDCASGGVWSCSPSSVGTINPTSGSFYGVSPGTATVVYTMGGMCSVSMVATVDAPPSGISPSAPAVCVGGTANLTDASAGGSWSISSGIASIGSATGAVVGITSGAAVVSYTLASGCFATVLLTVNPNPTISGSHIRSICDTDTIALSASPSGGVWSSSAPGIASVGSSGVVHGMAVGVAVISYTLATGCFADDTIIVSTCHSSLGLQQTGASAPDIYPNPAHDQLIIKTDNGYSGSYIITNEWGQSLLRDKFTQAINPVDISTLPPGLYFITLQAGDNVLVRKFVKM